MNFTKIVVNSIRACHTDVNLVTLGMEIADATKAATFDGVSVEIRWLLPDDAYVLYLEGQQFCWSADSMPIYGVFNNVSIFTAAELREMKEFVNDSTNDDFSHVHRWEG